MRGPNPFRDPKPFQEVRLGGRLLKAILIKVNGAKVEDDWKVDKSKYTSGGTPKFQGTKLVDGLELELAAADAEDFDDLYDIYDIMKPGPFVPATPSAPTTTPQTSSVGSPPAQPASPTAEQLLAQAQKALADLNKNPTTSATPGTTSSSSSSTSSQDNPGPRPPTLRIENAIVNFIEVFAVARKSISAPEWNDKANYWTLKVGFVQDKPPVPAGVGAMGPPSPSPAAAAAAQALPFVDAAKTAATGQAGGV